MGHGGNINNIIKESGLQQPNILDFSANINPLGPPLSAYSGVIRASENIIHYPDIGNEALIEQLSIFYSVDRNKIAVGNGSNELLFALMSVLAPKRVVLPVPCYFDYFSAAKSTNIPVDTVELKEETDFDIESVDLGFNLRDGDMLIVGRPNNPTGKSPSAKYIEQLVQKFPNVSFVLDEAFIDLTFVSKLELNLPNVIVLRSLTKSFAIPGLRLGALVGSEEVVTSINRKLPSWSVNNIAQLVGERLFDDAEYLKRSREYIRTEREFLVAQLKRFKVLKLYPGEANYILVKIWHGELDSLKLKKLLLPKGIAIRSCEDYVGLNERYFRIAVKRRDQNEKLISELSVILSNRRTTIVKKRPSLMFQGTSSDAGKSILATAFCRILKRHGVNVAPFKAQNMSLNSFVTADGLEMGRAQVTQAYAAKLEPDVRMNPVLLKPNSDTGAQVIINGKSIGNRNTIGYINYKKIAFEAVKESYDSLTSEYDAIILEGAGSPGEINLKENDIVNMRMAQYADSPVLLVGDIDRGGVFASFIGTYCTLEDWEKNLLKGFVVNKFRGDRTLLGDANKMVYNFTGREVFGTLNYLNDLWIPDEDSVRFKGGGHKCRRDGELTVGVINLPHISNATDLDPLLVEPDVELKIINGLGELQGIDLLVIPGSKNVISDLEWIKSRGLDCEVRSFSTSGKPIVGICGGLQILGAKIADPYSVEGKSKARKALGLIAGVTTLEEVKTTKQVRGVEALSGVEVIGYEIHHGDSSFTEVSPWIIGIDNKWLGVKSNSRKIYATYLHGVFDLDQFRRNFLDGIRKSIGLKAIGSLTPYDVERSIECLADHVEEEFDMTKVYQMMGL